MAVAPLSAAAGQESGMEWSASTCRLAYHFNRFTAGWRRLLVFYVAMCLAGYAQAIHAFVFWSAWGALVLMYWEPYLSPPFPWVSDTLVDDGLSRCFTLKRNTTTTASSTAADDPEERQAVRQWVLAIQRGLNETQLRVYKVIQGAIVIPWALMAVGVVKQATLPEFSNNRQALYTCSLLLAVFTVYTVSVLVCLWVFHRLQAQESEASRRQEVDWQPHDMLFFTCKILGETLNTVVQTLVAGAFTPYMPWQIFWLCTLITALSYMATNLLYDFDSNAPVKDDDDGNNRQGLSPPNSPKGFTQLHQLNAASVPLKDAPEGGKTRQTASSSDQAPPNVRKWDDSAAQKQRPADAARGVDGYGVDKTVACPPAAAVLPFLAASTSSSRSSSTFVQVSTTDLATAASGAPYQHPTVAKADVQDSDDTSSDAVVVGVHEPDTCGQLHTDNTTAASTTTNKLRFRGGLQPDGGKHGGRNKNQKPAKPPSPPFLKYKWPKGIRGRAIIALLLAVVVPSLVLLGRVGHGLVNDQRGMYLQDRHNECTGEKCLYRYRQMLVILGCLGCVQSYYAFTVGFLGAGPVTWIYRVLHKP